ncbi:hypothetical protein JZU71_00810, partial [bacterium]|nr:hypothetical protein [bacterium]
MTSDNRASLSLTGSLTRVGATNVLQSKSGTALIRTYIDKSDRGYYVKGVDTLFPATLRMDGRTIEHTGEYHAYSLTPYVPYHIQVESEPDVEPVVSDFQITPSRGEVVTIDIPFKTVIECHGRVKSGKANELVEITMKDGKVKKIYTSSDGYWDTRIRDDLAPMIAECASDLKPVDVYAFAATQAVEKVVEKPTSTPAVTAVAASRPVVAVPAPRPVVAITTPVPAVAVTAVAVPVAEPTISITDVTDMQYATPAEDEPIIYLATSGYAVPLYESETENSGLLDSYRRIDVERLMPVIEVSENEVMINLSGDPKVLTVAKNPGRLYLDFCGVKQSTESKSFDGVGKIIRVHLGDYKNCSRVVVD